MVASIFGREFYRILILMCIFSQRKLSPSPPPSVAGTTDATATFIAVAATATAGGVTPAAFVPPSPFLDEETDGRWRKLSYRPFTRGSGVPTEMALRGIGTEGSRDGRALRRRRSGR